MLLSLCLVEVAVAMTKMKTMTTPMVAQTMTVLLWRLVARLSRSLVTPAVDRVIVLSLQVLVL